MKLQGKRDIDQGDKLYKLLQEEITELVTTCIASVEDEDGSEGSFWVLGTKQPIRIEVFMGLINIDLTSQEVDVLLDIEEKHNNLIDTLSVKLESFKETINIYNKVEIQNFLKQSIGLLAEYYEVGGSDKGIW